MKFLIQKNKNGIIQGIKMEINRCWTYQEIEFIARFLNSILQIVSWEF